MEDLKATLELYPLLDRVYFTEDGAWYFHKPEGVEVKEKSREEIHWHRLRSLKNPNNDTRRSKRIRSDK
jgi:hypothetical protein